MSEINTHTHCTYMCICLYNRRKRECSSNEGIMDTQALQNQTHTLSWRSANIVTLRVTISSENKTSVQINVKHAPFLERHNYSATHNVCITSKTPFAIPTLFFPRVIHHGDETYSSLFIKNQRTVRNTCRLTPISVSYSWLALGSVDE